MHGAAGRLAAQGTRAERRGNFLALLFVALLLLFGGTSRYPSAGDLVCRLAAVAALAAVFSDGDRGWLPQRGVLLFLAALLALPLVQLMPLPSSLWAGFGGRGIYAEAYRAAGMELPALPISLTPVRTLDSAFFLLVPLAAFLLPLRLGPGRQAPLLKGIATAAVLSAIVSLLQVAGGPASPFRIYGYTHLDAAVGFFPNRNHFAVFMGCFIVLVLWWHREREGRIGSGPRLLMAGTAVALAVAFILLTQSRAGAALGLAGFLASCLAFLRGSRSAKAAAAILLLLGVAIGFLAGFDPLMDRFASLEEANYRRGVLPALVRMAIDVQPWGTGFGSFSETFRAYEDAATMGPAYWNHAHNEPLQLAIEGGVAAILLAMLFLAWWARSAWRILRSPAESPAARLGHAGAIITALLLLHSLVDYPLRTPALAALFALGCGWMLLALRERRAAAKPA